MGSEMCIRDRVQSNNEESGTVSLTAGSHTIRVQFFENFIQDNLNVSWQGPGTPQAFIPDSAFEDVVSSVCSATCGDGIVAGPEECDDNNATDNDGCTGCIEDATATCEETPVGSPSVCTFPPSFARIDSMEFNESTGSLHLSLNSVYNASTFDLEWSNGIDEDFYGFDSIPTAAATRGSTYVSASLPNQATRVRIKEIDSKGVTSFIKEVALKELKKTENDLAANTLLFAEPKERVAKEHQKSKTTRAAQEGEGLFVALDSPGIHGVEFLELEAMTNQNSQFWQEECRSSRIGISTTDSSLETQQIAYHCSDDGIIFYVGAVDPIFDDTRFVQITEKSEGSRVFLSQQEAEPQLADNPPLSKTILLEEDMLPVAAFSRTPRQDNLFWALMSESATSTEGFGVEEANGLEVLSLEIRAMSSVGEGTLAVMDGDQVIDQLLFSAGQSENKRIEFSSSRRVEDLRFKSFEGDVWLDSVAIEHVAGMDAFEGSSPVHSLSDGVVDLNASVVWDVTEKWAPVRISNNNNPFSFEANHDYANESIVWHPVLPKALDTIEEGLADVVVIYPRELKIYAEQYKDIYQALDIELISVESLFASHAGGQRDPLAINKALQKRADLRDAPSKVVVLFGDGHLDYRGNFTDKPNGLPPTLENTEYGLYPNDHQLAPNKVVARIPVNTSAEAEYFISKLEAYHRGENPVEGRDLKLVGAGEPNFQRQMEELETQKTSLELFESRQDLPSQILGAQENFDEVLYLGHSGLLDLGRESWLGANEIEAVDAPIWLAGTCLVNAFSLPSDLESLGETLVSEQSALMVMAPSKPSKTNVNLEALREWTAQKQKGLDVDRVYEAVALAPILLSNFSLLGDPLLPLVPISTSDLDEENGDGINSKPRGGCNFARSSSGFGLLLIGLFWARRRRKIG